MTDQWKAYLMDNQTRYLDEFLEFLRIPSISTDPAYKEDIQRAADWTANRLRQAGILDVKVMETEGHPVVYGEWLHAPDKPTVLFYGHYDVQPADPIELWTSPPFEPIIKNDRVYARGSSDMKGNILLSIIGCEALLKTDGSLPVNVKFLFEGEEEIGSPSLDKFIAVHRDMLHCDLVVSCDGGVGSKEEPVITVGRRGVLALEFKVKTASTDIHSGAGGGLVQNAIHELVSILGTLRDEEGRILVKGFYDGVEELTDEERRLIESFPFNPEEFKENAGIKDFFGEPEYTPMERVVARPTLEVNGIWGGYQGIGSKTVIPCEAYAKITCRLVPGQVPTQVSERIKDHIKRHASNVVEIKVIGPDHGAEAYRLPLDHEGLSALERVLYTVCGKAAKHRWEGSTVPVMSLFKKILGVETLTLGGSQSDRVHAPNEFFRLNNFERIQRAYSLFLIELGKSK